VLPRIKKLQAELPSVLLSMSNLRTVEIVAQLGEAQIDFGLVSTDDLPAGIESVKLGTLRYRICVPAAGAPRSGREKRLGGDRRPFPARGG
jgi:DNA-binding transcriptional LysR family regulator